MSHLDQGRFREIERRAFERYLLEVVREGAIEEERLYRDSRGEDMAILVREVELVRNYPKTALRIRTLDRARDLEQWSEYPIWDLDYEEPDGRMKPGNFIAGQILMMARGG